MSILAFSQASLSFALALASIVFPSGHAERYTFQGCLMFFLKLFGGTITGKRKSLSINQIKTALSMKYGFSIIEESSDNIRCKLYINKWWLGGLFGIPPLPRLIININREQGYSNFSYDFLWPDYLIAFVLSMHIGVGVFSSTHDLLVTLIVFILTMSIFSFFIYLETKHHSISIRMILENI